MKAVWWILTVALTLASVVVLALGVRQLDAAPTAAPAGPSAQAAASPPVADSGERRNEVLKFGREAAVRLLSYTPYNAERELTTAAEELTTEAFQDEFMDFTKKVIVPAAAGKKVTAEAQVPALAVESLTRSDASLLVFVNMRVTQGSQEPTNSTTSMRMILKQDGGSWRVAEFDPV